MAICTDPALLLYGAGSLHYRIMRGKWCRGGPHWGYPWDTQGYTKDISRKVLAEREEASRAAS